MTSRYSATITVDHTPRSGDGESGSSPVIRAVYESIKTDESFYPDNPVKTEIASDRDRLVVTSESDNLAHLRANLNSTLRLIQASYASIAESTAR